MSKDEKETKKDEKDLDKDKKEEAKKDDGEKSEKKKDKKPEKKKSKEQELQEQLDAAKDAHLRTAAEYANYRARSAKEKEHAFSNAKGTVIAEILPAIDNIERALDAPDSDYESLKKGVEMTLDGLKGALEKLGVETFGEPGDKFDPKLHNAVMHVEDENLDENVITDVFQKGYKIGDKVIRPAMVKTAN